MISSITECVALRIGVCGVQAEKSYRAAKGRRRSNVASLLKQLKRFGR